MNRMTAATAILSSIAGALVGGWVTYRVVQKQYEEYATEEIDKIRKHYALIRKDGDLVSFGMAEQYSAGKETREVHENLPPSEEELKEFRKLATDLKYTQDEQSPTVNNIFDEEPVSDPGPELSGPNGAPITSEKKKVKVSPEPVDPLADYVRLSGKPYIISYEDYFNTEEQWDKDTLSYYEGDDTLVDERDMIVDDVERYIGIRHLSLFGVDSKDKNVVYVRNPNISTDFEIVRDRGKASVKVFGLDDPDLEKPTIRRMRDSD